MRKSILVLFLFFVVRKRVWERGRLALLQPLSMKSPVPPFSKRGISLFVVTLGVMKVGSKSRGSLRLKTALNEPGVSDGGAESGSAEGVPQAAGDFILAGTTES
jgi:hypothetical protein